MKRYSYGVVIFMIVLIAVPAGWAAPPRMVRGEIGGRSVEGLELVGASNRRIVLSRDGWLHDFDPQATEHALRAGDGRFQPLDAADLRGRLLQEFGHRFDVVATTHFLVVTPAGRGDHWPQTFEDLHRTFSTFFSLRGVPVRTGNFPMVAIVMPDEQSMHAYLATLGIRSPAALGVYDRASNRIVMYDHGGDGGGVATTIRHEAAHQSAFNSGVHSRVADTPHWIVEGVGCLFQSPALVQRRRSAAARDRCDAGLLAAFEEIYGSRPDRLEVDLRELIQSDRTFKVGEDARAAYALSWAATFYLCERRSDAFTRLLIHYGRRPPLEPYDEVSRIRDFQQIVGDDVATFAARLSRFYNRL